MENSTQKVIKALQESIDVKRCIQEIHSETVVRIAEMVAVAIRNGGKVLLCGNGGSAADAQHLAAELLVRLRPHVNRDGIPAMALAGDVSSMTACSNDYHFECYYERMVQTLGQSGDVLIGITTSGNSKNILRSFAAARDRKMLTVGLLGCGGGKAEAMCDISLVVPSDDTARIQESHIVVGHTIMELVEDMLIEAGTIAPVPGGLR